MPTPIDSSSPFTGNANAVQPAPAAPEEFLIRTMQDDLLALQKRGIPTKVADTTKVPKKKSAEKPAIAEAKTAAAAPKTAIAVPFEPTPAASVEAKSAASPATPPQVIRPFVEKTAEPQGKKITEIPLPPKNAAQKDSLGSGNAAYKIILTVLTVLIIAIIGIGIYYFWTTRNSAAPVVVQKPAATPASEEQPTVVQAPPTAKYSAEKPNYLPLNLATLSTNDIQKTLSDTAADLKDGASLLPYEFIVVDANNNPVAFPIFATAAKLNLSPAFLSSLGENFSLFFYNDRDNVRAGLSVDVKNKTAANAEILKQEPTFVPALTPLFLSATAETQTGVFNSSTYDNYAIHYLNLNKDQTLSVDYALTDAKLLIGTSKDTLRAIIAKLATAAATTTPETTTAPTTDNPMPAME